MRPYCADHAAPRSPPLPQIQWPRLNVNAISFLDVDDTKKGKVVSSFENVVVLDALVGKQKKNVHIELVSEMILVCPSL